MAPNKISLAMCLFAGMGTAILPYRVLSQSTADEAVRMALQQSDHGFYSSTGQKELERLGDASSVALTKVFADKALTKEDISHILLVIKLSYSFPETIQERGDRKPRTTLYLLRSLSFMTNDPKTNTEIREATAYVRTQYAAYAKSHPVD
jgi:hypothetical protein